MNTLLLDTRDFTDEHTAVVRGRRARHLLHTLQVQIGSELRCGQINGLCGPGIVKTIAGEAESLCVELSLELKSEPPRPAHMELLCALPRPKMLRRMVRTASELGIKRLTLLNSYRVEKSYWQSPALNTDRLRQYCLEGLEQSGDTVLPEIRIEQRFKPFVEDRLPEQLFGKTGLLAHPIGQELAAVKLSPSESRPLIIAIGPEGGFIDYELDKLREAGMQQVSLGQRVLRCDTVLPYLIGRLQA